MKSERINQLERNIKALEKELNEKNIYGLLFYLEQLEELVRQTKQKLEDLNYEKLLDELCELQNELEEKKGYALLEEQEIEY